MKTKIAAATLALVSLVCSACEQHKWEETKVLFSGHGEHGAEAHGNGSNSGEHGKTEDHGEKKAEGHGEVKH